MQLQNTKCNGSGIGIGNKSKQKKKKKKQVSYGNVCMLSPSYLTLIGEFNLETLSMKLSTSLSFNETEFFKMMEIKVSKLMVVFSGSLFVNTHVPIYIFCVVSLKQQPNSLK